MMFLLGFGLKFPVANPSSSKRIHLIPSLVETVMCENSCKGKMSFATKNNPFHSKDLTDVLPSGFMQGGLIKGVKLCFGCSFAENAGYDLSGFDALKYLCLRNAGFSHLGISREAGQHWQLSLGCA